MAHDEVEHGQHVGFARGVFPKESRLAAFHVPIAKLAPEKTVQRAGGIGESVGLKSGGHFVDGLIEPA